MMAMEFLLATTLIFALSAFPTVRGCPTVNGEGNSCDECNVYDYLIHDFSGATMFLNVNISTDDIINSIQDFKRPVLSNVVPAYYGFEERVEGTDPPCYFHSDELNTVKTGCGEEITVNSTEEGFVVCPWKYECDYDKNRIPQYLWRATCLDSAEYTSRPITYRVPILKLDNICNPFLTNLSWKQQVIEVPVACVCVRNFSQ